MDVSKVTIFACLLLISSGAIAQSATAGRNETSEDQQAAVAAPADNQSKSEHPTSLQQLQKIIEEIDGLTVLTDGQKTFYASRAREEYELHHKILVQQYMENLDKVLDAWYANDMNWSKVPNDLWNKLTERDRGRIMNGIDPEIAVRVRTDIHAPKLKSDRR